MADYEFDDEERRRREAAAPGGFSPEEAIRRLEARHGLGGSNRESDIADLARRNPEDRERVLSELDEQYGRRATNVPGPSTSVPSNPVAATSQYSGGTSGQLDALMSMLAQDRQRQETERASMREILMSQLGGLQRPVSRDDPGIAGVLAANRNALQRGSERERRESAERRAYDESGGIGSKAFLGDVDRSLQRRGESEAQFEGNVLFQEMNARRSQLQQLLTTALQLGDAESARNIQGQLNAIQTQLQDRQFTAGLNQNQSQFQDQLGLGYNTLNANMNLQALMGLLGAA